MLRYLLEAVTVKTDAPVPADDDEDKSEGYRALGIMTLMLLLGLALAIGQSLEKLEIAWMSEAGGALIIGIVLGLIITLANLAQQYSALFSFNTDLFFLFLLPPIIFDAGFNLEVAPFFNNTGAITMLAFVGTAISTACIAVMMWLPGFLGLSYPISFFHSSLYGAIISATDPVTVLAVFGRLRADKNLNALVFGESVLNDAVAIVLYKVIYKFGGQGSPTFVGLLSAVWSFVYIFAGSVVIGVAIALLSALLFRTKFFRNEHAPVEAGLVIIFAYCSFYLAEGLGLSGITSIMFCGIGMAKYMRPNLSVPTDDRVGAFFRVIASLAEIFVFIYIGLALFTERQAWKLASTWLFIVFSLIALAVSRLANVYPITALCNMVSPRHLRIPSSHKHMLWFSGLRGAMAFALAMLARDSISKADETSPTGSVILTATFFMVFITVLVNGGATSYLLDHWNLFEDKKACSTELTNILAGDSLLAGTHANGLDSARTMEPPSPVTASSGIFKSLQDYQSQGGLTKQLDHLDKVVKSYVVATDLPIAQDIGDENATLRLGDLSSRFPNNMSERSTNGSLAEQ